MEAPPKGAGWLHEVKFDGYRTLARIEAGACRLLTRRGHDWARRYGDLAQAFAPLGCSDALIDGEVVIQREDGVTDYGLLLDALASRRPQRLMFFAFDLCISTDTICARCRWWSGGQC